MEVRSEASATEFSFSSDVILKNTTFSFMWSGSVQLIQERCAFLSFLQPCRTGGAAKVKNGTNVNAVIGRWFGENEDKKP